MKVFVVGSTGVLGRELVRVLLAEGHEVAGLARSDEKARALEAAGARAVVADALDRAALTAAVTGLRPDAIVHELTALAGVSDLKHFDEAFALTNRFRTEVTDTLLAAARLAGTRTVLVQSYCGWPFAPFGGAVKTEEDALDPDPPASFRQSLAAIRHLEQAVLQATDLRAFALRYGNFYGPGTALGQGGAMLEMVRKRSLPVVGNGGGRWSFIHVRDAAQATAAALTRGTPGLYNIVDDEPAQVAAWLPELARAIGAKPPRHVPAWLAKLALGEGGVALMTRSRGGSNAKAKRELRWQLSYPSWRRGFREGLGESRPHAPGAMASSAG